MSQGAFLVPAAHYPSPPLALVGRLKLRERQLQMLPAVAVEAIRLVKDPECSIAEFATVVERDVKLATDILKISNSALYSPAVPIKSLKQAVLRLGLSGCQNLILTASMASLMKRISKDQERISAVLWRHSYDTGLLASYLNSSFQFGFKGEEFAAGLIHDFGRLLLAVVEPEKYSVADSLNFDETADQLTQEDLALGTNHCRLGAWYAVRQHLPPPFPDVMLYHHQPELSDKHQSLTSLIAVADHMANHLQRFKTADGYNPFSNPHVPMLAKFGDAQFEEKFAVTSGRLMEKAMSVLETVKTIFNSVNPD